MADSEAVSTELDVAAAGVERVSLGQNLSERLDKTSDDSNSTLVTTKDADTKQAEPAEEHRKG